MKAPMTIAFIAMMTILSASVHAIPPVPPTPAQDEPAMIVCKDANALTEDEINELNADSEKMVSFDQELREICFYK